MCFVEVFFPTKLLKASNQCLHYEEIIYEIEVVIGIIQIKQQHIREFSDSPLKIICCCSWEVIKGRCYVAQIKIPFNIEKNHPNSYFCFCKILTLGLRGGDNILENQDIIMKMFTFLTKKIWKMQWHSFETRIPLNKEQWKKIWLFLWGDLIPSMK